MNEHAQPEADRDPAPIKHSDAERVTSQETQKVPAEKDAKREQPAADDEGS